MSKGYMQEDYNDNSYDQQYADNRASGGGQLNHSTLYVTSIPKALTRDGLKAAFSKFGIVTKTFLSTDPRKRYAMITFETPSEAKSAMMKLNQTEPLRLSVNIAHNPSKKDSTIDTRNCNDTRERRYTHRDGGSSRDDCSYTRSDRNQEEMANGDAEFEEACEDDLGLLPDVQNADLPLEMERLRLKHLKLQEAQVQCMQRMLLLNSKKSKNNNMNANASRSILPDGRIVVRNSNDNNESEYIGSGAGDSQTIPALQRVAKRLCVVCAAPAELYCGRCELTPYCGPQCQRTDWTARHSSVCHNLMRSSKPAAKSEEVADVEPPSNIQPATPLRKPHMSAAQLVKKDYNTPGMSGTQKFESTRSPNTRRPEKKPATNGIDTKPINNYPKPAAKETMPQAGPSYIKPVTREVPVPKVDTAPKVSATPAQQVNNVVNKPMLVPKTYLIETLSIGDTALLSVDAAAADCGTSQPGLVCLSLNDTSEARFQQLCGPFGDVCAAAERVRSVAPGESFAYFDKTDEAWYRARCLSRTTAALVDGCKLVTLADDDMYAALTPEYADVPEFCCVLRASGVALGNSLIATLVSKTATGYKVSLVNAETGAPAGEGEVSRWLPDVEYPKTAPVASAPVIPEVDRPSVANNSRVLLVEAGAADRALVRPADRDAVRRFDALLEDVLMAGINSQPLKEPPVKGQTVIGKFVDGNFYRALCRRTNVKQNKYLLEYIEFGNSEVTQLEKLYPCPAELSLASQPTQVALVRLETAVTSLTEPAAGYLEKIRDDNEELILTIPGGAATAPSGAEVCLTIAKNKESVNATVTQMCTPDWKKLEERGGDVLETAVIMNEQLQYLELPRGGCELDVLDASALHGGIVSACERGVQHALYVLGALTQRMDEYCNSQLGKEPYLPSLMEVCIAKCPPYPQWFRAVLVEHKPGELEAKVCYIDYGNIECVPVADLRKMLPEFVAGVPALALHVEIEDFPSNITVPQLERAINHLQLNEEGRGTLVATRCERRLNGVYSVEAPALIAAIKGV